MWVEGHHLRNLHRKIHIELFTDSLIQFIKQIGQLLFQRLCNFPVFLDRCFFQFCKIPGTQLCGFQFFIHLQHEGPVEGRHLSRFRCGDS